MYQECTSRIRQWGYTSMASPEIAQWLSQLGGWGSGRAGVGTGHEATAGRATEVRARKEGGKEREGQKLLKMGRQPQPCTEALGSQEKCAISCKS